MIESSARLVCLLVGIVVVCAGCRSVAPRTQGASLAAVAPLPAPARPPLAAAGYGFKLLPHPDRLDDYDRVLVTRGGDILQTLSLAQNRWAQSEDDLKRSRFDLFDVDRDGQEDLVLWSEGESISYITTWRFDAAERLFWPNPVVYYVRERIAPKRAAKPGAAVAALLLTESSDPNVDEKPDPQGIDMPLSVPILVHRDGRIVDFIENEEWVNNGDTMGLEGDSDDAPFVDVNFDGNDDLVLSRSPCSGNCYFAFWLFDPTTKRFNKHDELSSLASPSLHARTKEVRSFHSHGAGGAVHTYARYRFDGRDIVKTWESEQTDDVRPPSNLGGPSDVVLHRTVRARFQGKMEVICEGFVSYERDEVLALTRGDRAACKY